ncbi:gliding motility protein GldN [Flavilitoribacter nigricans DSM 23189 = NBRC 102662]|uniref:Gliding motility protein GldN n=1 Tax=Flavilitoribacter nigricans (strain ATCC 23147 / DSM 23189 / NBRC 102662 / NCIMB 1420 / SS-2) TaxID=1122177 RepID=A0A2D0NBB1_FLAN2|nr:gliding motility protein GldN [Flavilitoribacter nigricans DSM 23189 = NBRC 102662]
MPLFIFCQETILMTAERSTPLDGVVEKKIRSERRVLQYPHLRENDLLWEKRVWRLIDTREKMNLTFRNPKENFFQVLIEGIESGAIAAYSPENDAFEFPMAQQDVMDELVFRDTLPVYDPTTLEPTMQIIEDQLDPARVVRYRLKEVWYFDKKHGTLNVRILGIAPMIVEEDAQGNFKFERPLFWVYYPDCREWLARHEFYNEGNDHQQLSWEDLFEMRRFASYITKESNVHDERLEDRLSGLDRLLKSERINQEIFNFEGDLWSY